MGRPKWKFAAITPFYEILQGGHRNGGDLSALGPFREIPPTFVLQVWMAEAGKPWFASRAMAALRSFGSKIRKTAPRDIRSI
jgi:hypothetical protein